jgi:archaemetzincin
LKLKVVAICISLICFLVASYFLANQEHFNSPLKTESLQQVKQVCLLPIGQYDAERIAVIERGIHYLYGFETKLLDKIAMPKVAWYSARLRWRADRILNWMDTNSALWQGENKNCTYMMAITAEDISTTQPNYADWGILGLGKLDGRVAVSSSFRLHSKIIKPNIVNRRYVKIVNHEIGHMLGIPHVVDTNCLMQAVEGDIKRVDQEHGLLCAASEDTIENRYHVTLPKHDFFDWSQVE